MSAEAPSITAWYPLPEAFRSCAEERGGSVLLETARFDDENFRSLLFLDPLQELTVASGDQLADALATIDQQTALGRYVAGFIAYECGELFQGIEPRGQNDAREIPLLHFGVFAGCVIFDHRNGCLEGDLPPSASANSADTTAEARIESCALGIAKAVYSSKIQQVQDLLARGHSYQVNFTDRVTGTYSGSPGQLYRHLLARQPVSYAAYMNLGERQILSLSPELFYRVSGRTLTARPMKGTWRRGIHQADDEHAAAQLRNDPKNRAEHVTIVDLLRNDIGSVCRMGSVRVDELMRVERYPTLHQMTSTITGTLPAETRPSEIVKALFPSGSITGAPKRRTMEIIRDLECGPRGIYTGAIGWIGPDGHACFNVAIRTLLTHQGHFVCGVGGGITLDSDPAEEYLECKLKASFLQHSDRAFHLIETMRASNGTLPRLEAHLRRLRASAAYFQIAWDEPAVRKDLATRLQSWTGADARVRLTLDARGSSAITVAPLDDVPWSGSILLCSRRTAANDVFLHHKTSQRQAYEADLASARRAGFDEVFYLNQAGCLTEGAISNIFLWLRGALVTPEVADGLLPGVEREQVLASSPGAESRQVRFAELLAAEEIWVCNALRGSRAVTSIHDEEGSVLWKARGEPAPPV